jgi:uncharacterized protein
VSGASGRGGAAGAATSELRLRVAPGAKRNAWAGRQPDGRLKVKVAAPALEGRANAALIAFVAETLRLPRRAVRLTRGATGRDKVLEVDLDAAVVEDRLKAATERAGNEESR